MSSYEDFVKENDCKNWLKGSLALKITKEGVRDLVDGDSRSIQQGIHSSTLQARNLSLGTTCCQCLTENLLQCPTRGLCSHLRNCKFHNIPVKIYRPCPSHICDDFRDEICRLHRFNGPSWKNSHADQWCVNHWEIAKCFLPPDGYKDVSSFAETDFNGIISILINCTAFQQRLSFQVDNVSNILTQARDIGRSIRHSPDLKVTDTDLNGYITTLITLLSDPKYLSSDRKAQEAVLKLNQLQADTLHISNEDVHEILNEVRIVIETGKHQIEQAVTEGLNRFKIQTNDAIQTGLNTSKQLIKDATQIGERELYSRTSEGIEALDEAVLAAMGKIKASNADREEDLRQRLAKNYQKTLNSVPISPLALDKDEMLDKFYVAPRIVEKDHKKVGSSQQREGTHVSCYRKIFCNGDMFFSNIYVIGEAGMGKSTFSSKCAIDWGKQILHNFKSGSSSKHALKKPKGNEFQDVEVLAKFDFLFHVTLRYSGELCNLTDMITDQIISRIYLADEKSAGKNTLVSVLSNRKCLILADGLDEWSHPCDTKCFCREEEKIVPFLSSTIDATVLITSRPWRMAQHRVKDSRIDKYLEIEGAADTELLVQNVLDCLTGKTESEEKSMEFMSFIEERDLRNLLSVPIVVMMLVCLWFEGLRDSFSLCEIYALMIDMMFGQKKLSKHYRQQEKTMLPSCFQNAKHIFKYIHALKSTAKLAFEQLFSMDKKSALVFKQVGSLSHEETEIMLKSGIIRETKSQSLIDHSSSFSFVHKTVQEFLAALHLSYYPCECNRVVEPFFNRSGKISDISQVFIYICGLNRNIADKISLMICNTVPVGCSKFKWSTNSYELEHPYIREVGDIQSLILRGYMEACANQLEDIQINLHFFLFDFYAVTNMSDLKTLLSMNRSQVRYLMVYGDSGISFNEVQEIFKLSADTLTSVRLEGGYRRLDMSNCRKLKYLYLYYSSLDISLNAECLESCVIESAPAELDQSALHSFTSSRLIVGIVNRCSPLKHMRLCRLKNMDLFCQTLPLLSQLEYLDICDTDLADHLLHLPESVTRVYLYNVKMTVGVLRGLVKTIEENTHHVACWLSDCIVTPKSEFESMKQYFQSCQKYSVLEDTLSKFSLEINKKGTRSLIYISKDNPPEFT